MTGGAEKMNIQWFPGHMTRAQRMIEENLRLVDAVCEILDARIPASSRNPDIDRLANGRPRLVILNRCDLADPEATGRWRRWYQERGIAVLETDARSGRGVSGFVPAVRELLRDKREGYAARGQSGRALRERYKIEPDPECSGFELLEQAAKKRGFLLARGEYDTERMANTLLREYHEGKLGRLTLEMPDDRAVDTGK